MLYVLHGAKLGNLKYPGGSGIGAGMSFFFVFEFVYANTNSWGEAYAGAL
jgi:hypothetical protein